MTGTTTPLGHTLAAARSAARTACYPEMQENDKLYWLLVSLWDDLDDILYEVPAIWCDRAEECVRRIVVLSKAVGRHAAWRDVHLRLVDSGVWAAVHNEAGIPVDSPAEPDLSNRRAEVEKAGYVRPVNWYSPPEPAPSLPVNITIYPSEAQLLGLPPGVPPAAGAAAVLARREQDRFLRERR